MSYLGRKGASAALTSADIPNDSITAAKIVDGAIDFQDEIGFLENKATTQNLSGTYSTERMYLNDSYTLTGDVTVTGHLALGTVADSDVVITNDSSARTIDGSGTLESGELLDEGRSDLTGMTGNPILESTTTFPAGHILQIVSHQGTGAYATSTSASTPTGFIGGITITAGNKIWITASIQVAVYAGGTSQGAVFQMKDKTNSDIVVQEGQVYIDSAHHSDHHELDTVVPFNVLYTPTSGTTINFEVYTVLNWGGSVQTNRARSHMTLCEVQA